MHLAQINIGILKYPQDDLRVSDFMNSLDRVNEMAERMPGFVWRMKDESGNATGIETPWPGEVLANMSVWETPEYFEQFVWNTIHKRFYDRRQEWFETMQSHHFAMWWVEEGHQPTLNEAKERLDHVVAHGDTEYAFGWSHLPHVKLWQNQRCG